MTIATLPDYETPNAVHARAFSAGTDARLAGLPITANPHHGVADPGGSLGRAWRAGWLDAEKFWGLWARWPVKPLPAVEV